MLHLGKSQSEGVYDLAKREIAQMYENGVDAVLVENYFGSLEYVIWALDYLKSQCSEYIYGVNVLGNAEIAFSLVSDYDASFLQIDSVCGHLQVNADANFAENLSELRALCPVFLLGEVRFKYQPVKFGRSVEEDLLLGKERCDAVVVTGEEIGHNTNADGAIIGTWFKENGKTHASVDFVRVK